MSRNAQIATGVTLIAIAACWFFTPLKDVILEAMGVTRVSAGEPGNGVSVFEVVNLTFNALNVVIAALGVYFSARGLRPAPAPAPASSEDGQKKG